MGVRRATGSQLPLLLFPLLAPPAVHAQAPPPQPGIIERIAPATPPALGPAMTPPEPLPMTGPGEARRVTLGQVLLTGHGALPEGRLRETLRGLEGSAVTLGEIEAARLRLLRLYRAEGYPYVAVGASVAPQPDGAVALRFNITEGFIAAVSLEGEIGPAAQQALRFLEPLTGQRPLPAAALERALLLASDIPGIAARGVLRPLEGEPGALELVVQLARQPVTGLLSLDNRGYALTGAWQALAVGQLNAFTSLGERTEVSLLGTEANGQSFLQIGEEVFLGGSGLRLRVQAGSGRAAPGSALSAIGYAGQTHTLGAGLSHPVIRSRPLTLSVSGQLDAFESRVEARPGIGAARQRQSRDAVRVLRLGVEGAVLDAMLGFAPAAASTQANLRLHRGLEALGASDGLATARAGSDFGFTRLAGDISRLQPLLALSPNWMLSLVGAAGAQWSQDILPPAEKFYLGGNRLGRGFYAGQVAGDRALGLSAELQLAAELGYGDTAIGTQIYLFRDEGLAWDNGSGGLERRLASWGGGVRLQLAEQVQLDIEGVHRLTRNPEGAGVKQLDDNAVFMRLMLRF